MKELLLENKLQLEVLQNTIRVMRELPQCPPRLAKPRSPADHERTPPRLLTLCTLGAPNPSNHITLHKRRAKPPTVVRAVLT